MRLTRKPRRDHMENMNSEKYSRGRRGAPAKGVGRATGARVQIPLSPFPFSKWLFFCSSFAVFQTNEKEQKINKKTPWQIKDSVITYNTLLRTREQQKRNSKKNFKKIKKCLTNSKDYDRLNELLLRDEETKGAQAKETEPWELKIESYTDPENS